MTSPLTLLLLLIASGFNAESSLNESPAGAPPTTQAASPCTAVVQNLTGNYTMEGRPNIKMFVRKIPFTQVHIVWMTVNGQGRDDEAGNIKPKEGGGLELTNNKKQTADVTPTDGGLEFEMTSGPNEGRITTWNKD